jgi:tetratricopeptide (TPR) repeat protein
MAQKKEKKKQQQHQKEVINLELPFEPNKNIKLLISIAIAIISFALSFYYLIFAMDKNFGFGFPLDDPWIHLTFARNLVDYHSFSYFKNEMTTAGSTSPIYTLVLAVGFFIIKNEMILSYILGITFLVFSAIAFYRLSSFEFAKENYYALIFTGIFLIDKWLNFISLSGMETTLFIFILLATAYFYRKRDVVPFAVFLGLIMWGRPDGVTFIGAIAVDYLLARYFAKSDKSITLFDKKDLIKIGIISGAMILIYFGMNLMLSGSILPNTYTAKIVYYSAKSKEYFMKVEVWQYFTTGAYGIIMLGFIFSVLKMFYDLSKKKYNQNIIYIVFALALVFVYWFKMPYAHRFGRYMIPVIPFFILVSGIGFRDLFKLGGTYFKNRNFAIGLYLIVSAIILFYSVKGYYENKNEYAENCKYISDRQVAAALWIKNNTNENDIIATHDVGAIGYYCGRKIVDVAGLVTPELITKINDKNYNSFLTEYLKKSGVTYLAFLREWYRVVNQNPLFSTIEVSNFETMEVFKFIPDKTHILSAEAKDRNMYAIEMMGKRSPQAVQQALQVLQGSINADPQSSFTYYLLANAYIMLNDKNNFEKNMSKALEIFPEYKEALFQCGNYYRSVNKTDEAKSYLERYLKIAPDDKKALELYKSIDTVKVK